MKGTSMSKLDKSIKVMEFIMEEKQERIDKISQKLEQTQNEKIFIGQEIDFLRNAKVLIKAVKQEFNNHLGKVAPSVTDLEETVLGALLLEKNAINEIVTFLLPEHFYLEKHVITYKAILNLFESKSPIDLRTVVVELRRMGQLEIVGGAYFIAELSSKVSSAANLSFHAHVMIEFAGKREFIQLCAKTLSDSYEDSSDFFELLDSLEAGITKVRAWIK